MVAPCNGGPEGLLPIPLPLGDPTSPNKYVEGVLVGERRS